MKLASRFRQLFPRNTPTLCRQLLGCLLLAGLSSSAVAWDQTTYWIYAPQQLHPWQFYGNTSMYFGYVYGSGSVSVTVTSSQPYSVTWQGICSTAFAGNCGHFSFSSTGGAGSCVNTGTGTGSGNKSSIQTYNKVSCQASISAGTHTLTWTLSKLEHFHGTEYTQLGAVTLAGLPVADGDFDGVPTASDNCSNRQNPDQSDVDGDGQGNACDSDDDNDGVADASDRFPLDASESIDTDNDGIGNNADLDDDNDGVPDYIDAAPLSAANTGERSLLLDAPYRGSGVNEVQAGQ